MAGFAAARLEAALSWGRNQQSLGQWHERSNATVINRTNDSHNASPHIVPKELHLDLISSPTRAANLKRLDVPRLDKRDEGGMVAEPRQLLADNLLCLSFIHACVKRPN